jgi:hypothetical protein
LAAQVLSVLAIVGIIFGLIGLVGVLSADILVPRRFAELSMTKWEYSGKPGNGKLISEPECDIFVYWPTKCKPALPFRGVKLNDTATVGAPAVTPRCDHGGELWDTNSCSSMAGIGLPGKDQWNSMT